MPKTKSPPNPKPLKTPFHWDLSGIPDHVCWNRLRSLRENSGISQAELAVRAGVSISVVYQIELGHDGRTSDNVKRKIANFFDCKVSDVFPASMVGKVPEREFLKQKIEESAATTNPKTGE